MVTPRTEEFDVSGGSPADEWWFSWLGAVLLALVLGSAIHRHRLKVRRRKSLRRDDPRDRWDAGDAADSGGDGGF